MGTMTFTAVYMKVPEGYVAFVEELPGANSQGETMEEARVNLEEAVSLILEANREISERSLLGADFTRESLVLPAA
jgi:predicted RNase H-like HicB family nuclease